MNNLQLWYALRSNSVTNDCFSGVYSADTLPRVCSKDTLYVCNTSLSSDKGEHWICLYVTRDGDTVEFFDSLGRHPAEYGPYFVRFISNCGAHRLGRLDRRIQPLNSSLCGDYCLYYSFHRCIGKSFEKVMLNMPPYVRVCSVVRSLFTIPDHCRDHKERYQSNKVI